ncbi:uncharacterized protein LTR77_007002 [Saxophila tyrrhenica]|uniref:Uncharacterized protein n=1 Tax=Saxophila tyrrhenica TaxID=1690608 RepID=A0AAV9P8H1_9PEZI|nr:hypothetical protein LTR77_007002 [Saxophila tyrrhenica]
MPLDIAFNLGWKIANVVKGTCSRSILKTYQSERRRIAQDLIEFDHKFSRLFSGRPAKDVADAEGISMDEFKEAFVKGNMFASAVDYGASSIVAKGGSTTDQGDGTDVAAAEKYRVASHQDLATGIPVGKRIDSVKVLNQADARPWHLQELLPSNGRWRVLFFTGDVTKSEQRKRLDDLGTAIDNPHSFLRHFTPPGGRHDAVFELLAVHSAPRTSATIFEFPAVFRVYDDEEGYDYTKIYVDDVSYHEGHGKIYETFGISPEGCAVVIRPDQYVSYVGPLDDVETLNRFFSGFMLSPLLSNRGKTKTNGAIATDTDQLVM